MPQVWLLAVVRDMVVSFRHLYVICKKVHGESSFLMLNLMNEVINYKCRQVNVDYSVCHGLSFNSHGLREKCLVYDVNCQYLVNFDDRLDDVSKYLSLEPGTKLLGAIGKFHLADHVDNCFSKWTLNYLKGAGHIDGEIMETLWSGMNKVSGAARSMSKAHRQETLDDYMRDANWKKTVGIGKFILFYFIYRNDFNFFNYLF